MAAVRVLFVVALVGFFGPALTQDAVSGAGATLVREPRGHKKRLCKKYGICGQQGIGGYQGYQQGHQGYQQGHQGYQQGHQQGYPPVINIGISQSQSSASAGGGSYSHGYYPNNYQYNGHQPGYGGYHGGFGGFGGHQGFGRPGFSNGQGGFNNQFNGNYYGPGAGNGFGFPGQGGYFDEAHDEGSHDGLSQQEQNDQAIFGDDHGRPDGLHEHGQYGHDYTASGSFAFAGRKNN
ncbi:heterogeneous nuclear ribonucleoprotein A1-like [Cydia fagiglandana]|uniref:heterogeneous nuclear ribonucleoprotein A1-like n=1 Tax=Cydia fagiglandana TaxID=1458189 RepID=UPI002FEE525A